MNERYEIRAGFFIMIAVLLLVGAIWILGDERRIFSPQVEYFTEFPNVQGLSEGAPVRMSGITIGRISRIRFLDNTPAPLVEVALLVDKDYSNRITKGSKTTIETLGLLGDKFLTVIPGKDLEPHPRGAAIRALPPADFSEVLQKAAQVMNNTVEIAENVSVLLKEFRGNALDNISKTAANAADISERIKSGPGGLHGLLYAQKGDADIFRNLESASKNITDISQELKSGSGLLHALIYDRRGKRSVESLMESAAALGNAAETISSISSGLKTGKGLLHELLYGDSETFSLITSEVNTIIANLKTASQALAKGSGTLGALLIDSRLYDNLVEVTGDAKRSFILRHAIEKSLEQREEMRTDE